MGGKVDSFILQMLTHHYCYSSSNPIFMFRSTNHPSVDITLDYTPNQLPNVLPPMLHSFVSNVQLKEVDVSSSQMVLPSLLNWTQPYSKNYTTERSVSVYPTSTSHHPSLVLSRRVLKSLWIRP
jgi:hypothetical protein